MNYLTRRPLLARLGAALALAAQPASADDWRARWAYRAMIRTSISGQKASQLIHAVDPQKDEAEATRAADRLLRIYVELSERRGKTYEEAFQLVLALAEARAIHPPDGALAVEVMQLVDAVDELALTMGRSVNAVWRAVDALRDRDKLTVQRLETVRRLWEQTHSGRKSGHPADLIIVDDVGIDRAAGCSPHFPMDFTGPIAAGASKPSILTMRVHENDLIRDLGRNDYFWQTGVRSSEGEVVDLPKPRGTISEAERKRRNKARKTAKQARRKNRGR